MARAMPIKIDKIEVSIDFHIFAILKFDLLLGHPLENIFKEKSSHGSLNKEFRKVASATHLDILMAEHDPKNDSFMEVKFISPFVSLELYCELERLSPPSLKLEPCPTGHPNVILENKNFCAMDNLEAPTLELKKNDSANKHEGFSFETPRISCSILGFLELIALSAICFYEDHNHLLVLVSKLFRTLVVDAYVY